MPTAVGSPSVSSGETLQVLHDIIDFDSDGTIDCIRSLIDFGRGPVTIAFPSYQKDFGLTSEDHLDDGLHKTALVLCHLRTLRKLQELEGDIAFEVTGKEDGDWNIRPNCEIQRVELPEKCPSSIPPDEALPLYPGCHTVGEADITTVQELQYDTAEVMLRNQHQRYFFKHVNRKPMKLTLKEISALAVLNHPHIVPLSALVLDVSGAVIGLLFPFADHGSLKENVNILAPNAQKLRWVDDIVGALQYIAARGHKYEDIKAANIVVFSDGQARLTDFDGGVTAGHFDWIFECFGLGVLLEDLKCKGEGLDKLIHLSKTTKMRLNEFKRLLEDVIKCIN